MNVEDQASAPAPASPNCCAIDRMLEQGKPVLGICLGAQLLAHVAGRAGAAARSRRRSAGIRCRPPPRDARIRCWRRSARKRRCSSGTGYHFEIPDGAIHLARSDSCEQQAFRWGDNAYGFQFHLEMDEALIERWLANPAYRDELAASGLSARCRVDPRADARTHRRRCRPGADARVRRNSSTWSDGRSGATPCRRASSRRSAPGRDRLHR